MTSLLGVSMVALCVSGRPGLCLLFANEAPVLSRVSTESGGNGQCSLLAAPPHLKNGEFEAHLGSQFKSYLRIELDVPMRLAGGGGGGRTENAGA
eukprot:scaffold99282_cov21-Prasinocladus_malaysianus.AAC.1